MKLDARRVDVFLRDPGSIRVVLLYGDDVGLMRERATRLVVTLAGSKDDPFRVTELERDTLANMALEVASPPLTGGRRVVRARDVGDAATAAVQAVLAAASEGFLILEAIGLTGRSKLRSLIEQSSDAVAIGCYPPDAAALGADIRRTMEANGVAVDADALRWLETRLGSDRAVTRGEIEKLALYAGPGGHVDMAAAQMCVGDLAGLSVEDALFAATAGDVVATDRSLHVALGEGATPVGILRAGLAHLQRLHRARLTMLDGLSLAEASKAARPPVFFRREAAFRTALSSWGEPALVTASMRLFEAERSCKRTDAPAETICCGVILALAQRVAASIRR
jgi:DNA polymerase-3 subunit delta